MWWRFQRRRRRCPHPSSWSCSMCLCWGWLQHSWHPWRAGKTKTCQLPPRTAKLKVSWWQRNTRHVSARIWRERQRINRPPANVYVCTPCTGVCYVIAQHSWDNAWGRCNILRSTRRVTQTWWVRKSCTFQHHCLPVFHPVFIADILDAAYWMQRYRSHVCKHLPGHACKLFSVSEFTLIYSFSFLYCVAPLVDLFRIPSLSAVKPEGCLPLSSSWLNTGPSVITVATQPSQSWPHSNQTVSLSSKCTRQVHLIKYLPILLTHILQECRASLRMAGHAYSQKHMWWPQLHRNPGNHSSTGI